jgi:hypothetical protein
MFFKKTAISVAISLLIASSAFADGQQPPPSTQLDTVDYICAGEPLEYHCNTGGWHLDYIGMPEVWNTLDLFGDWQNGAGPVTEFSIGIYDQGFSRSTSNYPHEFIDFSVLESVNGNSGYGVGRFTPHGNMVAASVSAGKLGENFPTRPMIRAKTLTFSNKRRDGSTAPFVEDFQSMIDYSDSPYIIGVSIGFGLSLSVVEKYNRENNSNVDYDISSHWESIRNIRTFIESNSDKLFILSAGNNAKRSIFANGLLHREYDPIDDKYRLKKLDNLIVVGSIAETGTLARHSNYGRSVDIAAPSLYLGLSCANRFGSGIRKAEITRNTDILDFSYTERYGNDAEFGIRRHVSAFASEVYGFLSSPVDYATSLQCENDYSANGTSAAQPLVLGVAAILYHAAKENGIDIDAPGFPARVKNLLVYGELEKPTNGSGGLFKATRCYVNPSKEITDDNGIFEDARGDKVKDLPSNQVIPILDVAYSLNQFLATIPGNVTSIIKDGFEIILDDSPSSLEVLEVDDPRNSLGFTTLYAPPGEHCLYMDAVPVLPTQFPYSMYLAITPIGDRLVEMNFPGDSVNLNGVDPSSCSIFESAAVWFPLNTSTSLPFNTSGANIRYAGMSPQNGISIRSREGFYIHEVIMRDEFGTGAPEVNIIYDSE